MKISRRTFLHTSATAAATVVGGCMTASPVAPASIIDTHVHFYDPSRPKGVPWPPAKDALLYRTVLPKDYRALPVAQAVEGVIVVEASPWVEDNQWVLDLAAREPLIVGMVGNLPLGTPEFAGHLARFAANPLFKGVRIRRGSLEAQLTDPAFLRDLREVARRGLCFDVHSSPEWLANAERLALAIPELRLVINHVAGAQVTGNPPDKKWLRMIDSLARHPQVFMKVSGLVEGTRCRLGDAPTDPAYYAPVLDALWERFGADRLIYGSNWPVSGRNAQLATVQGLIMANFSCKGRDVLDKIFWKNARTAYG
ncbi:MAG: amidohydrolase family protein [Kiritimatiellae bacterium]|jgi:L-fuconolactonase|nr:amidohydrolase family protein [Kiritimatiellia bacterium]